MECQDNGYETAATLMGMKLLLLSIGMKLLLHCNVYETAASLLVLWNCCHTLGMKLLLHSYYPTLYLATPESALIATNYHNKLGDLGGLSLRVAINFWWLWRQTNVKNRKFYCIHYIMIYHSSVLFLTTSFLSRSDKIMVMKLLLHSVLPGRE